MGDQIAAPAEGVEPPGQGERPGIVIFDGVAKPPGEKIRRYLEPSTPIIMFDSLERAATDCIKMIESGRFADILPLVFFALIRDLRTDIQLNLDGPTTFPDHIGGNRARTLLKGIARAMSAAPSGARRSAQKWQTEQAASFIKAISESLGFPPPGPEFDEWIAGRYLQARKEALRPENLGRRSPSDIFMASMMEWIVTHGTGMRLSPEKRAELPRLVHGWMLDARKIVDAAPSPTPRGIRQYLGLTYRAKRIGKSRLRRH